MEDNSYGEVIEIDAQDKGIRPMFTGKQRLAIEMFALGKKQREVIEATGVSKGTVQKWQKNSDFQNEIAAYIARRDSERHDIIMSQLGHMEDEAIEVIRELLHSDNDNVRLKAATSILDIKKKYEQIEMNDNRIQVNFGAALIPGMPTETQHRGET